MYSDIPEGQERALTQAMYHSNVPGVQYMARTLLPRAGREEARSGFFATQCQYNPSQSEVVRYIQQAPLCIRFRLTRSSNIQMTNMVLSGGD